MRKSVTSSHGRRASSYERSSLSSGSHGGRASSGDRSSISGGPLRVNTDANRKTTSIPQHQRKLSTGTSNRFSFGTSSNGQTSSSSARNSVSRYSVYGTTQQQKKRMSRGSGMGMRGHTGVTKDPRPVSTRSYQQKCIKDLILFLTEKQYPHAISPKVLQSPTTADFMKIFEFIYAFFEPNHHVQKDDIPRILKQLGYPFTLSKSAMYSVGSPHTWPTLLAGLGWLIDLIKWGLAGEIEHIYFPSADDEFDSVPETKILYDYLEQTYNAYMSGLDSFEDFDEKLAMAITEKCCGTAGGINALEMEQKKLSTELELLENDMDKLKSLQEARDIIKLDDERYMDHLAKIDAHRQGLEKQLKEADDELSEADAEAKCAESNKQRMLAIFEDQKMSQADVERIKINGRELQRQRQEAEKREDETNQEIWQLEMELTKEHEKLEGHCNEYNKLAQKLKLIPLSAENAYGVDYELKPSYPGYMGSRFTDVIKPALMQVKKQCSESLHTKSTERMQVQESLEQVNEYVGEMQEDINMLESRSKRMGEELEWKKQVFQREYQQQQEEIEALQRELMELQTSSQLSLQDANRDLKNAQKMYEQKKMEMKEIENGYYSFMCKTIDLVATHLETIQGGLEGICQDSEQTLLQVRQEAQDTEEMLRKLQLSI